MKARAVLAGLLLATSVIGVGELSAQGQKMVRERPVAAEANSQTMSLLEGHYNFDSEATGGPELAVVDGSALVADTPYAGESFVDYGYAGTGQISTYIVRDGDTLSGIAQMFGVSVNTIAWANDIRGGKISIGQQLVILPISGVRHTVVKGDTLASIAKEYKADLDDMLAYNGLSRSSTIGVGDIVIVPDGELTSVTSATAPNSSAISVASGYFKHPLPGSRKTQGIHGHNGVDLAPNCRCTGDSVLAAAAGTVIVARTSGYNGGYGLYVVVSHANGTQTLYAHLSQVNVSVGSRVSQGQVLGKVGNTGKSTGPHLHFEVRGARNPF